MRIVDVEIISMLTPLGGERLEHLRGDARVASSCPAPTSDTRPIVVVEARAAGLDLDDDLVDHFSARPSSSFGTVNEMSVWPSVDTFCTIMSTFTRLVGQRAEHRGRDAGPVGHPDDRDLGLGGVVRDTRDDRLLHRRVLFS